MLVGHWLRRWFGARAALVAENDRLRARCKVDEDQLRRYDLRIASLVVALSRAKDELARRERWPS